MLPSAIEAKGVLRWERQIRPGSARASRLECRAQRRRKTGPETPSGLGDKVLPRSASTASRPGALRSGDRHKLRGCDVVKIKIGDLVRGGQIRSRAIVLQQKTGRPVQFELKEDARSSLLAWLERRGGTIDDDAFPSRVDHADHISTRQYARLVDEWVTGSDCGVKLRHAFAASDEGIDHLQGDRKPACRPDLSWAHENQSTVRYLGVDVEDALRLAEATDI